MKYRIANGPWRFTFQHEDVKMLEQDTKFLCLICGEDTICLLDKSEVQIILDLTANGSQWIKVKCQKSERMRVHGSAGKLSYTVSHNAFPKNIFQSM